MKTMTLTLLTMAMIAFTGNAHALAGFADGYGSNEAQACANAEYRAKYILGKGKGHVNGECTCDPDGEKMACYVSFVAPDAAAEE